MPGSDGIIVGNDDGGAVGLPLGSDVVATVGVSVGDGLGGTSHGPQYPASSKRELVERVK